MQKPPLLDVTVVENQDPARTLRPAKKYREAEELILAFIKTIKSYRIYAPKNPILKRFVRQLHRRLALYLEKHGPFRFAIEEFKFMFDGEVIYENESITESLPFLMHRNGLTELTFEEGLSYGELTAFLDTFRSYEILKDFHEDLVTLLWDKELSSIHFWATDDFLWAPIEIPQNVKEIVEKMEMPMGEQKELETETPLPLRRFRSGELDELKEAIPRQIEQVDYINLLIMLVEMVGHSGKDGQNSDLVFDFFRIVLDKLLFRQEFKNLIKILSFTKILIRDRRLDSNEEEFIRRITDYLSEPQSIDRLMALLTKFEGFDHELLQRYLVQLSTSAIAPLCSAWQRMPSAEGRMAISRALVELGKEDISALGRFLKGYPWRLVFNVVNILGKIGKDEGIPHISQVIRHENAKVRNEALRVLSLFNCPEAKALLPGFLNDQEMQVRINASKILAENLEAEALRYLGPLIRSPEFDRRKLKEKKAFLENLGRIREPDSVRILGEILYRRVLFKRRQWRDIKSCVEAVLASIDLDEARVALARWKGRPKNWFYRLLY